MNIEIKNELITYDFFYILLLFAGVLVLALCDTFMLKIIHISILTKEIPLAFSGLIFPFGLIISNIISEKYTPAHSYFFILILVSFQFLYSGLAVLISYIPGEHYSAYAEVYQRNGLICIGGSLGILIGYLFNHQSIKYISDTFDHIPLLLRDFISNVLSKFFICFFSYMFIFWFQKSLRDIFILIIFTWIYKIIIGSILIPTMIPLIKYVTHLSRINNVKNMVYR